MSINGSLREAALPDVLQLLAMGRKTGCLSLTNRGNFGSIYFDAGRICYASIVNRPDRIGQRLVAAGAISADALANAIAEQATQPDRRLGDLLVAGGIITRQVLHEHVRVQVEETVFHLYTWNDGTFTFIPGGRPENQEQLVAIDPQSLMLEGARRVDEWSLIAQTVPSFDVVFVAVGTAVPTDVAGDALRVLQHLDGRSLAQLAEGLGLEELAVGKIVHELLGRGLVRRAEERSPAEARSANARCDEHRNLGVAFYRSGMLDEAEREFRRVLELQPGDVDAYMYAGHIHMRQQRWSEAEACYDRAARERPGAAALHNGALALERQGRLDEACALLERAVTMQPEDARVRTALAVVHLLRGAAPTAHALFQETRSSWKRKPPAFWYHFAALASAWVGDAAHARELLIEGVAAHPRAATLHANLAALLEREGNATDALAAAQRAVAEDHALPQARKTLGDLHYRGARYDEALAEFEQVTAGEGAGADSWFKLGNIRLKRGQRDEAVRCWRRVLDIDPAHGMARRNLAALGAA